jgi:hypothetical protein
MPGVIPCRARSSLVRLPQPRLPEKRGNRWPVSRRSPRTSDSVTRTYRLRLHSHRLRHISLRIRPYADCDWYRVWTTRQGSPLQLTQVLQSLVWLGQVTVPESDAQNAPFPQTSIRTGRQCHRSPTPSPAVPGCPSFRILTGRSVHRCAAVQRASGISVFSGSMNPLPETSLTSRSRHARHTGLRGRP